LRTLLTIGIVLVVFGGARYAHEGGDTSTLAWVFITLSVGIGAAFIAIASAAWEKKA